MAAVFCPISRSTDSNFSEEGENLFLFFVLRSRGLSLYCCGVNGALNDCLIFVCFEILFTFFAFRQRLFNSCFYIGRFVESVFRFLVPD